MAENTGRVTIERRHTSHEETLIPVSFRAFDCDWPALYDTAKALCESEYPGLRVSVAVGVRNRTGGTAFYTVRVPLQHAQMMAETAEAMLDTHRPNVDAIREQIWRSLGAIE